MTATIDQATLATDQTQASQKAQLMEPMGSTMGAITSKSDAKTEQIASSVASSGLIKYFDIIPTFKINGRQIVDVNTQKQALNPLLQKLDLILQENSPILKEQGFDLTALSNIKLKAEDGLLVAKLITTTGVRCTIKVPDFESLIPKELRDALQAPARELTGRVESIVNPNANDEAGRVDEAAQRAFKTYADSWKTDQVSFANSHLQKLKDYTGTGANGCTVAASSVNIFAQIFSHVPGILAVQGSFLFCRGIAALLCNMAKCEDIHTFGLQKYNQAEIFYTSIGLISSVLFMLAGLFLIAGSLLEQVGRVSGKFLINSSNWCFGYIYCYGLSSIISMLDIILESIKAYRVLKFRKEINSCLENPLFTDRRKCLTSLKKIKERLTLTTEEKEKIKEKVLADYIKKNHPENADQMVRQAALENQEVKNAISLAEEKRTKEKIEALKKMTSGDIINKLIEESAPGKALIDGLISKLENPSLTDTDPAINETKGLVLAIDKVTYQNLITHYVYIALAVICLTLTVVGLLAELSIITLNPWVLIVLWLVVAALYLAWDYSKTNNFVTGFIYDNGIFIDSRKKKASKLLPPPPLPNAPPAYTPTKQGTFLSNLAAGESLI